MEKQTIWFKVEFQVEHKPDNLEHLQYVARNHFASKGITVQDNKIII